MFVVAACCLEGHCNLGNNHPFTATGQAHAVYFGLAWDLKRVMVLKARAEGWIPWTIAT